MQSREELGVKVMDPECGARPAWSTIKVVWLMSMTNLWLCAVCDLL